MVRLLRRVSAGLIGVAIVAGTAADQPRVRPPLVLGGYRVLAADFHMHSATWSDGALTPWGLVLEAERQGLDVIAVTGHNQVSDAKLARWFSHVAGGPTVLVGQEAIAPAHHIIAVGIDAVVDASASVAEVAAEIHRQGGVAIVAHPFKGFWPAYDATAMAAVDGAEICHPAMFTDPNGQQELEAFAAKGRVAAIGSSDFHGMGRMGACRTYVFARDNSAEAVIEALRAHRTVVYGPDLRAHGDPALIALAAAHPELRDAATVEPAPGWLDWISRVSGVIGLAGIAMAWPRSRSPAGAAADAARRRG